MIIDSAIAGGFSVSDDAFIEADYGDFTLAGSIGGTSPVRETRLSRRRQQRQQSTAHYGSFLVSGSAYLNSSPI